MSFLSLSVEQILGGANPQETKKTSALNMTVEEILAMDDDSVAPQTLAGPNYIRGQAGSTMTDKQKSLLAGTPFVEPETFPAI